jgi:Fe-S cluster assembly protein SufD
VNDTNTIVDARENVGAFGRDQLEILTAARDEASWLRERRAAAYEVFASEPMPDTRPEAWRYTAIRDLLDLEKLELAEERRPVSDAGELGAALAARVAASEAPGRVVQVDASVVLRELSEELRGQGVILTSLEQAAREHPELVRDRLGGTVTPEEGKFAAMNGAFWTGGVFLHVPEGVRVEVPLRLYRWMTSGGTAAFGRVLVVAGRDSSVAVVEELGSADFDARTFSLGALEIYAEENARVHYIALQRYGSGVAHLATERVSAGRDARVTTLALALGSDVTRVDAQCALRSPGSHVDLLGLYIAQGTQHIDYETLQDHVSPHASSNLLFKGALFEKGRSVFRGLIRVHPNAQRTDAYQTNRNLIMGSEARADSLPNLEIAADDVRCSHAATVGQLDEEEIFYLLSRGIPKHEAIRLVIFGFFGEVLDQLELKEVRQELVDAIERKLGGIRA